jgi:hypothetical protein
MHRLLRSRQKTKENAVQMPPMVFVMLMYAYGVLVMVNIGYLSHSHDIIYRGRMK